MFVSFEFCSKLIIVFGFTKYKYDYIWRIAAAAWTFIYMIYLVYGKYLLCTWCRIDVVNHTVCLPVLYCSYRNVQERTQREFQVKVHICHSGNTQHTQHPISLSIGERSTKVITVIVGYKSERWEAVAVDLFANKIQTLCAVANSS